MRMHSLGVVRTRSVCRQPVHTVTRSVRTTCGAYLFPTHIIPLTGHHLPCFVDALILAYNPMPFYVAYQHSANFDRAHRYLSLLLAAEQATRLDDLPAAAVKDLFLLSALCWTIEEDEGLLSGNVALMDDIYAIRGCDECEMRLRFLRQNSEPEMSSQSSSSSSSTSSSSSSLSSSSFSADATTNAGASDHLDPHDTNTGVETWFPSSPSESLQLFAARKLKVVYCIQIWALLYAAQ
jgi:hypothetical protein